MSTESKISRSTLIAALPPDPENMNEARASFAGAALRCFQQETGTEDGDALTDLLCDLMHWTDRHGGDFEHVLCLAERLYEAEITPPQSDDGSPIATSAQPRITPLEGNVETPYWRQRIHDFVALKIQPHMVMRGSSCGSYLEPCAPEKAEVWTVTGCYRTGRIEPCEDFTTETEARHFRDGLISVYPHLGASGGAES